MTDSTIWLSSTDRNDNSVKK